MRRSTPSPRTTLRWPRAPTCSSATSSSPRTTCSCACTTPRSTARPVVRPPDVSVTSPWNSSGTWTSAPGSEPDFAGAKIVPFEEQLRCYAEIDPELQFEAETKAPSEYAGRMEPALDQAPHPPRPDPRRSGRPRQRARHHPELRARQPGNREAARAVAADRVAVRGADPRGRVRGLPRFRRRDRARRRST